MPTSVADVRRPGPTGWTPRAAGRRPGAPAAPTLATVPAAASSLAPSWLLGEPGPARVVASFADAAYLLREDEVLPLLAPGALALPGGLRVGSRADLDALGLVVGTDVRVGAGRVEAAGGALAVRRTWRPRAVPTRPLDEVGRRRAVAGIRAGLGALPAAPEDLPPAVAAVRDAAVDPSSLVGLGPGLTPAGDDVLAGLLLGLRACGRRRERTLLAGAVLPLLPRTTALSATLLRQAAEGYAVPPVVELLHAWHADPAREATASLVGPVAAVGHTSGRALLLGLAAALAPDRHDAAPAAPTPYQEGPS